MLNRANGTRANILVPELSPGYLLFSYQSLILKRIRLLNLDFKLVHPLIFPDRPFLGSCPVLTLHDLNFCFLQSCCWKCVTARRKNIVINNCFPSSPTSGVCIVVFDDYVEVYEHRIPVRKLLIPNQIYS